MDSIPFELHITIAPMSLAGMDAFLAFCTRNGAKPLLIELSRGDKIHQPMVNKIILLRSLEEALMIATELSEGLNAENLKVERLKIEVPADCSDGWGKTSTFKSYFEWHGKINYVPGAALDRLCELHRVHLSLNALKGEKDTRFITLREFGGREAFEDRIKVLSTDLARQGWPLIKEVSEWCIYDNNLYLDKGWLPQ